MKIKRNKYIIQYFLIACIFFIQIIILFFFHNEFYNYKKVEYLEKELLKVVNFQNIIKNSRKEIYKAQNYLQDYFITNDRILLEKYFLSLEKLSCNLDSIDIYKDKISELDEFIFLHKKTFHELPSLDTYIDSIYKISELKNFNNQSFDILPSIFIDSLSTESIEINIEKKIDSLPPKKLLSRLKDAFTNSVDVKKEITIINTKYVDTLNSKVFNDVVDSFINVINLHYEKELKKIIKSNTNIHTKYEGIYKIYEEFISLSINWMDIYTLAINDFNKNLREKYSLENSKVNKIRHHTILFLMF